jgi:hypothetical protein
MFNHSKKTEAFNSIVIFMLVMLLLFAGSYSNPAEAETVTEAQRNSGLYQAYQAWQARIVPRISIDGQHDSLSEYAAKCKAATGIDVPNFSCSNGRKVPGQGDTSSTHCDQPNVLNGACDPGSKFQVLLGRTADAVAVAHCRKVKLPKDDDNYNDIAVIQYNKKNGALCFYQALGGVPNESDGVLPGSDIPAPIGGEKALWKDGKARWMSPMATEAIGCTGCHDNGGFIRSEYLAQLKPPGHVLPNTSEGFDNFNTPVKYVGLDYETNRSWSITAPPAPNDSGCTGCHRLAVPNRPAFRFLPNGTAAHFSVVATAATQESKNAHSATSPIWMRLGQTVYDPKAEASAKIIQNCAQNFWNSGFKSAPPECTIKTLGEPLLDIDNDGCTDREDQHPLDANPVVAKLPSIPNTCPNNVVRVFEGNDTDKDGIPNCKDTDDDNDGIPDDQDICPTVKPDRNILSLGCGFGITSCPLIKINVLGVCFGSTCIEDFRIKLDWVVNLINPPVEVATFDRFWMEAGNLYISKRSLNGNRNSLQTIANQLSIAPDSVSPGWFRLSVWSRNTSHSESQLRAVVAEYAPNQISVSGTKFTGSSIRLSLPQSPSGKLLIENSDKTEPAIIDKKVENDYSAYLSAILILAVIAVITLIAIKK